MLYCLISFESTDHIDLVLNACHEHHVLECRFINPNMKRLLLILVNLYFLRSSISFIIRYFFARNTSNFYKCTIFMYTDKGAKKMTK